jgi:hypothetical protein
LHAAHKAQDRARASSSFGTAPEWLGFPSFRPSLTGNNFILFIKKTFWGSFLGNNNKNSDFCFFLNVISFLPVL